jgi:membrane protein implicated in regulation of membrane protease activity
MAEGVVFSGDAKAAAWAKAHSDLARALASGCKPVPCPSCGWYQTDMVPLVQARYLSELNTAGLAILLLGVIGFVISLLWWYFRGTSLLLSWLMLAVSGLICIVLMAVRGFLGRRHDPNAQPDTEQRKAIGGQCVAAAEKATFKVRRRGVRWSVDTRCPNCGVFNAKKARSCSACKRDLSLPPASGDAWWEAKLRQGADGAAS